MSKVKVDKIEYWNHGWGIHVQAIKNGEPVGGTAVVSTELEMVIYIKGNFILPE